MGWVFFFFARKHRLFFSNIMIASEAEQQNEQKQVGWVMLTRDIILFSQSGNLAVVYRTAESEGGTT